MKTKIFISIAFLALINLNSISQIKVFSSGQVGIYGVTNPIGMLHVNGNTYLPKYNSYWINSSSDIGSRLRLHNNGINSYIDFYQNLYFRTSPTASTNVHPLVLFSSGNVGILTDNATSYALNVNGSAYFYTAFCNLGYWSGSDSRLKRNIKAINNNAISSLFNLNAKSYQFIVPAPKTPKTSGGIKDTSENEMPYSPNINTKDYDRLQFGYLAEDVEKIYPNLVKTDSDGYKSVNYIALIPIIIEAMKKQQSQIDSLTQLLNGGISGSLKSAGDNSIIAINKGLILNSVPTLSQNTPNPFNQSTTIKYFVPESSSQAVIYIYNMEGYQIKSILISNKGNGSIDINAGELKAGMYFYTLIIDGKEIDTKKMILTQ